MSRISRLTPLRPAGYPLTAVVRRATVGPDSPHQIIKLIGGLLIFLSLHSADHMEIVIPILLTLYMIDVDGKVSGIIHPK